MASTTDHEHDSAPRPKRRTFPAEYRLRIVAEYDAAPNGEKGAILRRERLYHSHIIEWRAARDAGARSTLVDKRTSAAAKGIAVASAGCAAISGKLLTMAWNHLLVDDAAAAALIGGKPQLDSGMAPGAQECEPANATVALPQVEQHHNWAVNHLVAPFWPEGNPDTLEAAATTWHRAATYLQEVGQVLTGAVKTMVGECEGVAFDAFYTYADQFVGLKGQDTAVLSQLTKACSTLSQSCSSYAAQIRARRAHVEHMAEVAGVATLAGAVLSFSHSGPQARLPRPSTPACRGSGRWGIGIRRRGRGRHGGRRTAGDRLRGDRRARESAPERPGCRLGSYWRNSGSRGGARCSIRHNQTRQLEQCDEYDQYQRDSHRRRHRPDPRADASLLATTDPDPTRCVHGMAERTETGRTQAERRRRPRVPNRSSGQHGVPAADRLADGTARFHLGRRRAAPVGRCVDRRQERRETGVHPTHPCRAAEPGRPSQQGHRIPFTW